LVAALLSFWLCGTGNCLLLTSGEAGQQERGEASFEEQNAQGKAGFFQRAELHATCAEPFFKNVAFVCIDFWSDQSLQEGLRVVIDLDFEDYMVESDKRHLCQQLSYSYSANKAADVPLHMILASFTGATKARALGMVSG
jgi:hypothetical protein